VKKRAVVAGVGESTYYERGRASESEFQLACIAIRNAVADAGLALADVDGFVSYMDQRNDPMRLALALGCKQLTYTAQPWGGGGNGMASAVMLADAAVSGGFAKHVVVFRALAQGQFGRFGQGPRVNTVAGDGAFTVPYGVMSPAQTFAMRVRRFMHDHGAKQEALRAIALASYRHAQSNPRAVMYGRALDEEAYDHSRWIVEPFHLFDCCMENDGGAALVLVAAERARDLKQKAAYILAAAQGSAHRQGAAAHNAPDYATSNFKTLAPRLYAMAGVGPDDVDVLQSYENFTGGVMMSIVEHGFCAPGEVNDFFTLENFSSPKGRLPLNTSGGNLAECYMHGLELITEAVRQVRGSSTCQVPDVEISMVTSGPMVQPVSNLILATERG